MFIARGKPRGEPRWLRVFRLHFRASVSSLLAFRAAGFGPVERAGPMQLAFFRRHQRFFMVLMVLAVASMVLWSIGSKVWPRLMG